MEKQEVEKLLLKLGANPKTKGFEMLVDITLLVIDDVINNNKPKYHIKEYYYYIANKYETGLDNVPANIRTTITTKNVYGSGMSAKDAIDYILTLAKKEKLN